MNFKDVLIKCSELGDFPTVESKTPIKHHPNKIGKITQINKNGFSVDFGGEWKKWFWFEKQEDKRSSYTDQLNFFETGKEEPFIYIHDIRNKLSPICHMITMLDKGKFANAVAVSDQSKISVNYLSNRKVYDR